MNTLIQDAIAVDIDGDGFVLRFRHNPDIAVMLQMSVPGTVFRIDKDPRGWSVPTDRGLALVNELAQSHTVVLTPAAQKFIDDRRDAARRLAASAKADTAAALALLPEIEHRLAAKGVAPFAHQRVAFDRMIRARRLVLADDMGLGKTLSSIVSATAVATVTNARILILSPASVVSDWHTAIELVSAPRATVHSWAKVPEGIETPYCLVADEAHYAAAGTRTIRGRAFLNLAASPLCIACWPLTGTPMPNGNPQSMWALLRAVNAPHAADGEWAFYNDFGREPVSDRRIRRLHSMNAPYVLRRTKEECLDLPDRLHTIRRVTLGMEAARIYRDALVSMRQTYDERIESGAISSEGEAIVMLNHVRAATSIGKVASTVEVAKDILAQGDSVVIFSEFVASAKAIAECLEPFGVELLTGEVPTSLRAGMKDRFQDGTSRVFVSTGAGGVGITLTRAHDVILHDRPWRPEDTRQRIDRVHRIGQTETVNVQWIQADAVDRYIDRLHVDKLGRIGLALHGDAGSSSISALLKTLTQSAP